MVVYYELRICNRHANFIFTVQDEIFILPLDMGDAVLFGQTRNERFSGQDKHVHRRDFCEYTLRDALDSSRI